MGAFSNGQVGNLSLVTRTVDTNRIPAQKPSLKVRPLLRCHLKDGSPTFRLEIWNLGPYHRSQQYSIFVSALAQLTLVKEPVTVGKTERDLA